jgi:hypothetical protein
MLCAIVAAQNDTGHNDLKIMGRVTDPKGDLYAGVQVRAKHPEIRIARSASTDASGSYVISRLIPGRYLVSVDVSGLIASREVEVTANGPPPTIDLVLSSIPASLSQEGIAPSFDIGAIEKLMRQREAERKVEQLWGIPLGMIWTVASTQVSDAETTQKILTKQLHGLGTEAVTMLSLALRDPDVQMRRNAALMLLDLAGGFSLEARPALRMPEILPMLMESQTDTDAIVRDWAGQAVRAIQAQGR